MITTMKRLFEKYRETILYLFFGGLTTVVNFIVHFSVSELLGLASWQCTVIAWIVAVIFAFLTNKPFVFESNDWSAKVTVPEFLKFVGCRVGSGAFETLCMFISVDLLRWNELIMKILVAVVVIIINYIGSKIIFKKK